MKKITRFVLCCLASLLALISAPAQVTTYQGVLTTNGNPANGTMDFQFTLWDAASDGNQIAATTPVILSLPVSNGLFTAQLDFVAGAFPGAGRYLQIQVRTGPSPLQTLVPRQQITPTPYAITAQQLSGTLNGN